MAIYFSDYFIKRKGFWSGRFLSYSLFFDYLIKPLVFLDVQFLEKSQYWPKDRIREIQWARIKDLISKAERNIPFWRGHLRKAGLGLRTINSWDDFERIPTVSKDNLRALSFGETADLKIPQHWLTSDSTSGSTGVPFQFFIDRSFVSRSLAFGQRIFRMAGQKRGDVFVRFSPIGRAGMNFGKYWFEVLDFGDFEKRVNDFINLYRGRTVLIYGVSSYLVKLAEILSGKKHSVVFRAAFASGEPILDIHKKLVEKELKCPLFRCYVSRELGWIAQECSSGSFHVNSEGCYLEIVDKNDGVLPPNTEGRVVVTNFDNEVMPFIRYDTGDLGKILSEPCPCGRTLPVIEFMGRQSGFIKLSNDRWVHHFRLFSPFHHRADYIKRFQIIQDSVNQIRVKIVPDVNFSDSDLSDIKASIRSILGVDVLISFELVGNIPSGPRGKTISFISNIDV